MVWCMLCCSVRRCGAGRRSTVQRSAEPFLSVRVKIDPLTTTANQHSHTQQLSGDNTGGGGHSGTRGLHSGRPHRGEQWQQACTAAVNGSEPLSRLLTRVSVRFPRQFNPSALANSSTTPPPSSSMPRVVRSTRTEVGQGTNAAQRGRSERVPAVCTALTLCPFRCALPPRLQPSPWQRRHHRSDPLRIATRRHNLRIEDTRRSRSSLLIRRQRLE